MDIPEHILKKILDVLKEEGNIEKVIIFGSRVKGTSKAGSDIDIALVGENINLRQILRIGSKIEDLDLPYKVDLISYKDIKDKNLKEEIDKFGVEIELKN
ncbi:MAG: nucleotidyltransferase domain-containing protein [Aquificaceae bacterium]|jgi:predicted nucleotidyltransferase